MQTAPASGRHTVPAFTLIEFIVVMALLATLMAVVAPRIANSMRQRNLEQEATRIVALSEYGRDQAVSRGIPMVVWLNPETSWLGLAPKPGYPTNQVPTVEFALPDDVSLQLPTGMPVSDSLTLMEFSPEGNLELESVQTLILQDQSGGTAWITLRTNGWGYETISSDEYALRLRQSPF